MRPCNILAIALLAPAAGLVTLSAHGQTGGPPRTATVENLDTTETFATIQEAIDDADTADGHTLRMLVTAHAEGPQIHITKDLTIKGGSPEIQDTIKATGDTGSSGDARGWFLVDDGVVLHVRDLIFDGDGYLVYQAFRHKGSGSFANCGFTDIKFNESGPHYSGLAIAAFGDDGPVDISGCTFDQIGRIGVLYFGPGISGSVYFDNVYTGKGDGDWLDYGVELGAGAVATITNCTITDCRGVASSDGSTSAGILATTYYGPGTAGTVTSTILTANTTGIAVGYDDTDTTVLVANYNSIFANTSSGVYSTAPLVDALNNWWGDASGPEDPSGTFEAENPPCYDPDPDPLLDVVNSNGLGNDVSDGNVDYCPWLLSPAVLSLLPDDTCYGDGVGATVTVTIRMSEVKDYVVGGQFFLEYDETKLDFVSAEPGDPPFTEEVYEDVDEIAGTIDYATGAPGGDPGTPLATDMAVLTFTALVETCGTADLITFRPHDPPTRLTSDFGDEIVVLTNDLGAISIDAQSPVLTPPPNVEITCKDDSGPDNTGWATATDNCGPDGLVISFTDVISGNCQVLITRTWTATDECGNSDSTDQLITVNDDFPPVFTFVPPDVTITCKEDTSPSNTGWATAQDNCDPADPVIGFTDAFSNNCPVLITRTWTATDKCGNSVTADQVITVNDNIGPLLTLPPDVVIGCKESTDPADTGFPTATDNCSPDGITFDFTDAVSGQCSQIITRTWTATDKCGNTSLPADQIITVVDDIPPVLTLPPNVTITCKDDTGPDNTGWATATDNCTPDGIQIGFLDVVEGNCLVTITRTWTATDKCGNSASADQLITVNDDIPPALTLPPDVKITCKDDSGPDHTGWATAADNCDPAGPVITFSDEVSGNCPVLITRTWMATDKCGNIASADQLITVNDDFPPVLMLPPDIKITCKDDSSPANTGKALASDNCNPVQISFSDAVSGNCPVLITRTWTTTDECGNSASGDQLITVNDPYPPVLTGVPEDLMLECDEQVPPPADVDAVDNCDPNVTVSFDEQITGDTCETIITRTWTSTDKCGNTASATQTIALVDTTGPTVTCPTDPPVLGCDEQYKFIMEAEDNCFDADDLTITCDAVFTPPGSGTLIEQGGGGFGIIFTEDGSAVVTCTATDPCDNESDPCSVVFEAICCALKVSVEGCVVPEPLFDACDGKVTALTLVYTGEGCGATEHNQDPTKVSCSGDAALTEPVDILVTNENGSEVYADVTGVLLGEEVLATATNAGQPDFASATFITILDAASNVLEEIEFQTSCTEPLAPGNQFGSMLLWGMVTTNGGEVTLPDPDECITEFVRQTGDACDGALTELVLQYTGEDCSATSTNQDPSKYSCAGDPGFAGDVRVLVTNDNGSKVYADVSGVAVGDEVLATAEMAGDNDFDSVTRAKIFTAGGDLLQEVTFHASCSEPLGPGDQFGALLVTGMTTTYGGTVSLGRDVEYTYSITNNSNATLVNVTVIDDTYGEIPGSPIAELGPGETVVLTLIVKVFETTTNTVVVTGELGSGTCEAEASATVTALEPPKDCCEYGKPRVLVLRYTGDDCSATNNPQEGDAECDDIAPLLDEVYIIANTKSNPADGTIWFEGTVALDGVFVLDAASAGDSHLANDTHIHIYDAPGGNLLQHMKIKTSCSKPLCAGNQFGAALVLDCFGEDEALTDCNENGVEDAVDIANGTSDDENDNGVPDECECPCDCAEPPDLHVTAVDFLALLAQWGGPGPCDCEIPPDGTVDAGDFLALLAAWGACP